MEKINENNIPDNNNNINNKMTIDGNGNNENEINELRIMKILG